MKYLLFIILVPLSFFNVNSQNWDEIQRLDDFDGGTVLNVAIDNDHALVGTSKSNAQGTIIGSVYFYEVDSSGSWNLEQIITEPPQPPFQIGMGFGNSLAIDGDYAIIGAKDFSNTSPANYIGKAFIYKKQSNGIWIQIQELTNPAVSDYRPGFGHSVAIKDGYIIISSYGTVWQGDAYIFKKNNNDIWSIASYLEASDPEYTAYFGWSVDINDDYAIIGAPQREFNNNANQGAAYIFSKQQNGNWIQTQKLLASDGEEYDRFGESVSLDNNHILIGTDILNGFSGQLNKPGKAYIFKQNSNGIWFENQILRASSNFNKNRYGYSVSIDRNIAIIGSFSSNFIPDYKGSLFVLQKQLSGDFNEIKNVYPSQSSSFDYFGYRVDLSKKYAVVASHDAAYIFMGNNNYCDENLIITRNVNSGDNDVQSALSTITATNIIYSGGVAEYDAGVTVYLKPGFNAKTGSNFRGYIKGCTESTSIKIGENLVKTNENLVSQKEKVLILHPNPTSGLLNMKSEENMYSWEISNPFGIIQRSGTFKMTDAKNVEIDLSNLITGVYYVKVVFQDGEITTKTLIKE